MSQQDQPDLTRRPYAAGDPDAALWRADDPALAIALRELAWYGRRRDVARLAHRFSETTLLLCTAGTTVAAGLRAPGWVTATLAAVSLVLVGLRRAYDWQETWVIFSQAWTELRTAVQEYRLANGSAPGDPQRQRELLARVHAIVATEQDGWSARRRAEATTQER